MNEYQLIAIIAAILSANDVKKDPTRAVNEAIAILNAVSASGKAKR